jgi:hypothetical protein
MITVRFTRAVVTGSAKWDLRIVGYRAEIRPVTRRAVSESVFVSAAETAAESHQRLFSQDRAVGGKKFGWR